MANIHSIAKQIDNFLDQPDDPIDVRIANALDRAIESVLLGLGVPKDLSQEDSQKMLLEKEIQIADVHFGCNGENSLATGIYIYQGRNDPTLVAYVSYPYLNRENKIVVRIERHDKYREITTPGIILPK